MPTCWLVFRRSFQSTPVITDGRTQVASVDTLLQRLFQSTPVITDGRTLGSVP